MTGTERALPRESPLLPPMAGLLLLALAIKVAFLILVSDSPFVIELTNDEVHHVQMAETILR